MVEISHGLESGEEPLVKFGRVGTFLQRSFFQTFLDRVYRHLPHVTKDAAMHVKQSSLVRTTTHSYDSASEWHVTTQ